MNDNNMHNVCPCCGRPMDGTNMMQMGPMVYYGTYPVSMPGLNWPPMSAYGPWGMPMQQDWMTDQMGGGSNQMSNMGMGSGSNQMGAGQMCNNCRPSEFGSISGAYTNQNAMGSAGNQRIPFPENLEN